MSTTLHIESFNESNIRERTTLAEPVEPGAESIIVKSTQGYAQGDIIYAGELSREGCERAAVAAVVDETTLSLTEPLKLAHAAYEPVTTVLGDRIKVYRAVNVSDTPPPADAFTVLVTRSIDPDQTSTYYRDSAGSSGYWYRWSYFNETTLEETDLSEPIRGDDFEHYTSLRDIRLKAGLQNAVHLKDTLVDLHRRAAEAEINATLANAYTVPFKPVPEIVKVLTTELAAAMLLEDVYSRSNTQRLKDARAAVQRYSDRTAVITDEAGNSTSSSDSVDSYFGEEPRSFRIGQRF